MEKQFKTQTFKNNLISMLKVDFKRMFTMRLVYIMIAVSFIMPILILVMTTMNTGVHVDPVTGIESNVETFTNVWQSIGSLSDAGMSMGITSMCNINMLYFLILVFVCLFVCEDFRSGYSKNLFTVRPKKLNYCISKTLVGFIGGGLMILFYFVGAMIGGAIAGLSFALPATGGTGILMCMIAKIFLVLVFVSMGVLASVIGKSKTWLSIIVSCAIGMLLFTMIPMITPLDSSILNVILCGVGGLLFTVGLGSISNLVLNKTSLV